MNSEVGIISTKMSEKFKDKYITKSTRLENYDYAQNGLYFVTICTKDREELFGSVINGGMILNNIGKIANQFWQEIPKHFPFVILDEFVVMPNHLHGILEIWKNPVETQHRCVFATPDGKQIIKINDIKTQQETNMPIIGNGALVDNIETHFHTKTQQCCVSTVNDKEISNTFYKLKPGSLSVIIRSYKSVVSKIIRTQLDPTTFSWQPKFYDHIIRNDESLNKIREYIIKNPQMWERDRSLPENVFV
jgi:REP element-mobilizing transposase RayT